MQKEELKKYKLSTNAGVYKFLGARKKILYIGRATNLKSRVNSYFSKTIEKDRGGRIKSAILKTKGVEVIETDSVLEAYLLEAHLIKKHQPYYNIRDRDNKSFNFVIITREDFPRVLIKRARELEIIDKKEVLYSFGPFPKGLLLKEALSTIRKIFPFRDKCKIGGKPCFNYQIGLCSGVCFNNIDKKEYKKIINGIRLLFIGNKKKLLKDLNKNMLDYAKKEEYEKANIVKKKIFSLQHIQDVSLIKEEARDNSLNIEAFDISHISGSDSVGVVISIVDGDKNKNAYRVFNIKNSKQNDIEGLKEILERRFSHSEWKFPRLIVIDGGRVHLKKAKEVLSKLEIGIPIVSVVKDERHRAREILGEVDYKKTFEKEIIEANKEAHRFALSKHREKRKRSLFK